VLLRKNRSIVYIASLLITEPTTGASIRAPCSCVHLAYSLRQLRVGITCSTTHWRTLVTGGPHQNRDASSIKSTMVSQHKVQKLQQEGRLALLKQSFQNGQFLSFYKAAKSYSVPETSLRHRVNGCILIAQSNAKKRKLQPSEE
jgi:helix-turn-helix, Psq domain